MSADKTHELLPPNAPVFMRDVLRALNFDSKLDPALDSIRDYKWPNPPDEAIPWLLNELSLAQFSDWRKDDRALYEEGRELNRVKGTRKAVRMVARWFGFEEIMIRTLDRQGVHFPEFELGLDKLPDKPTDLCELLDAINRVKPLRSRFRRVWYGYDGKMFVPSQSPWGDLLGDYSGLHSTQIGLCVSKQLCKQDLRISFRVYDTSGLTIDPEIGDYDLRRIFDAEQVRDRINFPVPSQDFNGQFYPLGFGSIGERESGQDNEAITFDSNRDWPDTNWTNDPWPQPFFGFIGESDIADPEPAVLTDSGGGEFTDDGFPISLD